MTIEEGGQKMEKTKPSTLNHEQSELPRNKHAELNFFSGHGSARNVGSVEMQQGHIKNERNKELVSKLETAAKK